MTTERPEIYRGDHHVTAAAPRRPNNRGIGLSSKAILEAVGELLGQERAKRVQLEAQLAELRNEVEVLKQRGAKLRAVPPPKIA
jgi:hypothetical protein